MKSKSFYFAVALNWPARAPALYLKTNVQHSRRKILSITLKKTYLNNSYWIMVDTNLA